MLHLHDGTRINEQKHVCVFVCVVGPIHTLVVLYTREINAIRLELRRVNESSEREERVSLSLCRKEEERELSEKFVVYLA